MNFKKRCARINCHWVVWDGCCKNLFCYKHCECIESREMKKEYKEKELYIYKQRYMETNNSRELGK